MAHQRQQVRFVAAFLFMLCGHASAEEHNWENVLASRFSRELRPIRADIGDIDRRLASLPDLPIEDLGGSGGVADTYPGDRNFKSSRIEVRWPKKARIDMVALVPARLYDSFGLDPQFGMPDDFTVDLLDSEGRSVQRLATVRDAREDPIRRGHPFVFAIATPVEASGIRVEATRLPTERGAEPWRVHAWAEILAFEGLLNVAEGGQVSLPDAVLNRTHWHWSPSFVVDGMTPLGLPEMPGVSHSEIGWVSQPWKSEDHPVWVQVDLGRTMTFDGVRLFPAHRPREADNLPGFAIPPRLRIEVSETSPADGFQVVFDQSESDLAAVGNNALTLRFAPHKGRFVKIVATRLWRPSPAHPAFFAMSEMQVLDAENNLASGARIHSSDPLSPIAANDQYVWSAAALTDGFGTQGPLLPQRDWLEKLATRHKLESNKHALEQRAGRIVQGWHFGALASLLGVAGIGMLAVIVLPVRYRIRSRRELRRIRQRITGDLHDEVGSSLGSIQIYAGLATAKAHPLEELATIQRIASETVSAVRDIVWLLRPDTSQRIGTVEHLKESSAIMLEALEWTFESDEPCVTLHLPEDANRHLFLFHREAMHNILRHAGATRVEIHIQRQASKLQLVISDNGCGISPARLARPSTLRALRQRADSLHGSLEVESTPDNGTRLSLCFPVTSSIKANARQTT